MMLAATIAALLAVFAVAAVAWCIGMVAVAALLAGATAIVACGAANRNPPAGGLSRPTLET